MSSIDDRIVNMQFNNGQFQQNIGQTNESLKQLNQNLELPNGSTGIDGVQASANRFSLANIESALDSVNNKLGVFGAIGFSVINNLTNTVLDAGKSMASALVDPLVQGGAKRALAIQQAQFQFKGLGLDINATMQAATNAVTGTAFSLDQAATAASAFGASGITASNGLQDVLRSVAGVAAQTGTGFDSVANIFETVAGLGHVSAEQLNQLAFQGVNATAILAKQMGITQAQVKDMVSNSEISFQQFSDAMNKAFGDNAVNANQTFSGALANMHAALARIGALFASPYFLDMRDIFNALSPIFDKVKVAVTPLATLFTTLFGSFSATNVNLISNIFGPGVVASIQNVVQGIITFQKIISGAFDKIFPSDTAGIFTSISVFIQKITEALIPSAAAAAEFSRVFAGIFAIFDIVGQIIGTVVKTLFNLLGVAAPVSGSFLEVAAKVGDLVVKFDDFLKRGQYIQNFFRTIGGVIAVPIAILRQFFGIIADGVKDLGLFNGAGKGLDDFAKDVQGRFQGLVDLGNFFNTVWQGVLVIAKAVGGFLGPIFKTIGDGVTQLGNSISDALGQLSFKQGLQILQTGIFGGLSAGALIFLNKFANIFQSGEITLGFKPLQTLVVQFKAIFTSLRVNLKALEINTNAKTLKEIAVSVALLAASAVAMSLVDPAKLGLAMGAIVTQIGALLGAFAVFGKINSDKNLAEVAAIVLIIDGLAGAIIILAGAVAILGAIPILNLLQGVGAVIVLLGALTTALKIFDTLVDPVAVIAGAGAIAVIAPAMVLLAGSVALLGLIPFVNLLQGVGAVVVLLGALTTALKVFDTIVDPIAVIAAAAAIALIAPAIALLSGAVALMGALPFANIVQGMLGFGIIIVALTLSLQVLADTGPSVLLAAAAMYIISLAIIPLVGAVALLGQIPVAKLAAGIIALGVTLAILSGVVLLLGATAEISIIGALALLVIAGAVAILAPALFLLSKIPGDAIGTTIGLISAALGVLIVLGILLIPASVGFLLFGVALLAIGTAVNIAATGLGLLAAGLAALMVVGAGGVAVIGAAIGQLITQLPALGFGFGQALVAMVVAIGAKAPELINAFVEILLAMLAAIDQIVPQLVGTAVLIITTLVNALVVLIPLLVNAGLTILQGILNGIASHIQGLATTALLIISNFINGLAAGLPALLQAGANLILSFINGLADTIRNNHAALDKAIANLADALTGGLSTGITNGAKKVITAISNIANDAINAAKKILGIKSPSKVFREEVGEQIGAGMSEGVVNSIATVVKSVTSMGNQAVSAATDQMSNINDAFNTNVDIQPTIRPVVDLSDIQSAAKQIPGLLQTPTLSLATTNDVAQSVSLQEQAKNAQMVLDASAAADNRPDVTLNQYNSSPKALSVDEVYRNTNNQISKLKGVLGVVDQSGS